MFDFIKEKLKSVVSKFSKRVEEEVKEVKAVEDIRKIEAVEEEEEQKVRERKERAEQKERVEEKKKEEKEIKKGKKEVKEEIKEKKREIKEEKEEIKEKRKEIREVREIIEGIKEKEIKKEEPEVKKAKEVEKLEEEKPRRRIIEILKEKIIRTTISDEKFEELFKDLELVLLENNVAVEVIEKIKRDLKKSIVGVPLERSKVSEAVRKSLRKSIEELFSVKGVDLLKKVKEKRPCVIVFVGINGSGKTTTIAKIAKLLINNKMRCVLAASDTFRAASQEQLEEHAKNLNVKLVKHGYGADPAAVAFDAIKYAQAHEIDAALIDTAGRLHSNVNLMDEVKKIIRVAKPDLVIFVGEAITGNDCIEQAQKFNEAVGIDGIILAKADVDEKGGAAISVSYVTKKPIMFLGTGQRYEDLKEFSPKIIVDSLGL